MNNRVVISTIVGGGSTATLPALQALMTSPTASVIDPLGRGIFVVDERDSSSLLRFVNTTPQQVEIRETKIESGSIYLVAGGGTGGEGTPLEEVELSQVTGMAVDPGGQVIYLLSPLINSIRALNIGRSSVTVFGVDIEPNRLRTIWTLSRSDARGLAISPTRQLYFTATGPGNLGRVVYQVSWIPGGGTSEVLFAGGGSQGGAIEPVVLINPLSVAVDRSGNVYIAEAGDTRVNPGRVRKLSESGESETLITGLEFPVGLAIDSQDVLYVALGGSQQIIRLTRGGGRVLVAGSPNGQRCEPRIFPLCRDGESAVGAFLNLPGSIKFQNLTFGIDNQVIYLPDLEFRRVRAINLSGSSTRVGNVTVEAGTIRTIAGNGLESPYDQLPANATELNRPTGMAVDPVGNLYLTDSTASPYNLLRFVNRGRTPVTLFEGTEWAMTARPGEIISLNHQVGQGRSDDRITTAVFQSPSGLAMTPQGLFIVDSQYGALIRSPNSLSGRRSGHVRFLNTSSSPVVLFPNGGANRMVILPGEIEDVVGRNDTVAPGVIGDGGPGSQAVIFPSDLALDDAGNLFIADQGHNLIRRVDARTGIITSVPGEVGGPGETADNPLVTNAAVGIAFAGGRLHIADTRNDRILRQDVPGGRRFSIIANASQGISRPRGLMVDEAGQVLVVNNGSQRILRIVAPRNELGSVTTITGTGSAGFSGDGGRASLAKINLITPGTALSEVQYPSKILALSPQEVIFTDTINNRIRLLTQLPNQVPEVRPISDINLQEGASTIIDILATDADGDPLTLALGEGAPLFISLEERGDGGGRLLLQPGFSDAGVYSVTIQASDGEASRSQSFMVTVVDVNRAPVVQVQPIVSPVEATSASGRVVRLSGTATDPDGDSVAYQWFNQGQQIASTPEASVTLGIGTHSLVLIAQDNKGLSAASNPLVVVVRDSSPPVFVELPPNQTVPATSASGAIVSFPLPNAIDLVDGSVSVSSLPAPGALFPVGMTIVRFTASDSRGNVAEASFSVTVTPPSNVGGGGGGVPSPGGSYTITTIAGTGSTGNEGNDGPALAAT
ncbi:MAG: HYR domain-containing protein, partial [Blastocatellia bacterium]